jgi:hypothetical protein
VWDRGDENLHIHISGSISDVPQACLVLKGTFGDDWEMSVEDDNGEILFESKGFRDL